jgi:hypothetical protein
MRLGSRLPFLTVLLLAPAGARAAPIAYEIALFATDGTPLLVLDGDVTVDDAGFAPDARVGLEELRFLESLLASNPTFFYYAPGPVTEERCDPDPFGRVDAAGADLVAIAIACTDATDPEPLGSRLELRLDGTFDLDLGYVPVRFFGTYRLERVVPAPPVPVLALSAAILSYGRWARLRRAIASIARGRRLG